MAKIPSFQSLSLTMKESMFRIFNRSITTDAIRSYYLNLSKFPLHLSSNIWEKLCSRFPLASVFHLTCQCCVVCFLESSMFLFRSLACRPIGITQLFTYIADLDTVPYADATLSAVVHCTDDKILILQWIFNAPDQTSLP